MRMKQAVSIRVYCCFKVYPLMRPHSGLDVKSGRREPAWIISTRWIVVLPCHSVGIIWHDHMLPLVSLYYHKPSLQIYLMSTVERNPYDISKDCEGEISETLCYPLTKYIFCTYCPRKHFELLTVLSDTSRLTLTVLTFALYSASINL